MNDYIHFRRVFDAEPHKVYRLREPNTGKEHEVASFVSSKHYAENFAKQWRRFRDVQLDSANGTTITKNFLEQILGDTLESLSGQSVLEVGAGAGRFTEYLVRYASLVVAFDLSEAIFTNAAIGAENLILAQADLLNMLPMKMRFDLVFCRGVLQHTPSPKKSIEIIHQYARPGGMVVFDIYPPGRLGRFASKYIWRRFIQRFFTYDSFSRFLDRNAARMLRLRWWVKPLFPWKTKRILDYLLPIWDYRGMFPLSESQLIEWAKLDTLDAMFAKYDKPLKYKDVLGVLKQLGCELVSSDPNLNFFRTRIPAKTAVSAIQ